MDVHMPKMDGLEATAKIREIEQGRTTRTPILALTAAVYAEDKKACRDAGMDDFLEKPLNRPQVFSKLNKWLGPGFEAQPDSSNKNSKDDSDDVADILPGLELKKALTALGCGMEIYKTIAETFYKENLNSKEKIQTACAKEEWPLLERLAHSLKSTGATVGAFQLSKAALTLEKQCREGFDPEADKNKVESVAALLSEVMESLASFSSPKEEKSSDEPLALPDKETLSPLLNKMAEALDLADTQSITEALETLKTLAPGHFLASLASQIDEYDYEEAMETLTEMRSKLGS
jgi:two-component system sensor histidine kinase/response regulator